MDAVELIEALESLSHAELDIEIEHQRDRLKRLERLRTLIGGKMIRQKTPRTPKASGGLDDDDNESNVRRKKIIAVLEAGGPQTAGAIASQVGCAPQAVGLCLRVVPGAEQDESKVWSLPVHRLK